jgi:hypothetical protein
MSDGGVPEMTPVLVSKDRPEAAKLVEIANEVGVLVHELGVIAVMAAAVGKENEDAEYAHPETGAR